MTVMSIVRCLVRFDAALVLFFLVLAPGLSRAQTPPKVTIAYAAVSPIFAGVWMAKEMGAFEKHGVKADLIYISSGSVTVQAMVGGNLDMSVAAINAVVSSILRGAPLVAVGSITNRPAMSLFVQPEITKPEQLQGKVLGITRHGSSTHFLTQFVIEKLIKDDDAEPGDDGLGRGRVRRRGGVRDRRARRDDRRRCTEHEAGAKGAHVS